MVATRPDWCISRQRAWGVPIAVFVEKLTGEVLRDPAVMQSIVDAFRSEGADAWYQPGAAARFLGPDRDAQDYEQVMDIVDVWFESGSTHAFVLPPRNLPFPADLYLEGSDQHRGWFQSSLLESVGTRGVAPFKAVLTHGFVLDETGRKMSKSLGNVTAPQEVIAKYGADILRLWVMNVRHGRRPAHRQEHPGTAGGTLPPHPQHAALAARQLGRLHRRHGARAGRRDAGTRTLGAAPPDRTRRPRPPRRADA
jgi:isoleucyl-tRNA synthetase